MRLTSGKKKGFFHILEVVIVTMMIFVVLTQLYSVPKSNQPWDIAKLSVLSQDVLYSLEASGVDWLDATEVSDSISAVLPSNMGYSVSVSHDIRPVLRIGCVCNVTDYAIVASILTDFTINGIPRDFVLTRIEPSSLDMSEGSTHSQNDAILFCGNQSRLSGTTISDIERFLSEGKGIVEFSRLSEDDVSAFGPRWYGEVMNLQWVPDTVSWNNPSDRSFFPYIDADERRYPVRKIFMSLPPALPSFGNFDNFGRETVYPQDRAAEKIMVIQDSYYQGGSFDGLEVPLSTIDWGVNGSGRVAWMSQSPLGATADEVNARRLLKALVSWAASGREYQVVPGTVSTGTGAVMRKVFTQDMYEPVKISLRIGYHY